MKKILVVEDDEKNMYLIRFILQDKGFEVIEARDGAAGVELAVKEKPDLIIMDIQLPVLDGYEATKRIKANKETKDIPVIALTSYAMPGDREKSLDAGCDSYITKPIKRKSLMAEVEKLLEKSENN